VLTNAVIGLSNIEDFFCVLSDTDDATTMKTRTVYVLPEHLLFSGRIFCLNLH